MGLIMCVGSNSWCRWLGVLIVLSLSKFSFASALPKEIEPETRFNRIMSQTVSNTFDRLSRSANSSFYEIGKSVNDELFNKNKLSVIKNIAKANTGVIKGLGGLYLKHPLVGVAVSYGFGTLLDYALDNNGTGYALAKKDNKGRYYVDIDDRGTIKRIYLEESNLSEAPYVKKPIIKDFYTSVGGCKGVSEDIVLSCLKEKEVPIELKKIGFGVWKIKDITLNKTSRKVSESGDVITYSLNYNYESCLQDDSRCYKENRDLRFQIHREQKKLDIEKGKVEIKPIPIDEALPDAQEVISTKEDVAKFIRSVLSVGAESLTPEERHLVANIAPEDVASTVPEENPSVTGADLKRFSYSEAMLKPQLRTASSAKPSEIPQAKPNENTNNSRVDDAELDYPELDNPTARQILQPLQRFFPNLQRLHIQERAATCPVWSFEALNRTYTINSHCDLIEKYRSTLSSLFILVWSLISLRKLLSA
jgi:hypothetical protein